MLLTHFRSSAFDLCGSAAYSNAAGSRVAATVATNSAFPIPSDALPDLSDRVFYRKAHENLRKIVDGICATSKLPEEIAWFELSERELQKRRRFVKFFKVILPKTISVFSLVLLFFVFNY